MMLALAVVLAADQPKFTPDQCKVMRQVGINTDGLCPEVEVPAKKTSRARPT